MQAVVFDVTEFRSIFPEFKDMEKYPDALLQWAFDSAVETVGNCPLDEPAYSRQKRRLYLVTAHIAYLLGADSPSDGSYLASASEGSVSVSQGTQIGSGKIPDYWARSKWGIEFWQISKNLNSFFVVKGRPGCYPPRVF